MLYFFHFYHALIWVRILDKALVDEYLSTSGLPYAILHTGKTAVQPIHPFKILTINHSRRIR